MAEEDSLVKHLGITPEQIIGYIYSGMLAAILATIIDASDVKILVDSVGGFLAALAILILGIGIYVLYFRILGEFLLYPVQHLFHLFIDWLRKKPRNAPTSCMRYLGFLGVRLGFRRAAYEAIKALYYEEKTRQRIQFIHGELHVLYITSVELVLAACYLSLIGQSYAIWFWSALFIYIAALLADTKQHIIEASLLRAQPVEEINSFLRDGGYIVNT